MQHILFICTGNTCRSPLAEGLMRKLAKEAGLTVEVRSAGVYAVDGGGISHNSATILKEHGADLQLLESSSLKGEHVDWADLILTMTLGHKSTVLGRYPDAIDKTYALKEFVDMSTEVMQVIEEREQLISDLQLKLALSQPVTEEEKAKLMQLEQLLPDFDIMDPFGGSLEVYRQTAHEIEQGLRKLIQRIQS